MEIKILINLHWSTVSLIKKRTHAPRRNQGLISVIYVRVYLVGYIFCIIDYHICRDIFGMLYILYNRLPYMSGYI
jgi:hypothetical protein